MCHTAMGDRGLSSSPFGAVWNAGIEPATFRFQSGRHTIASYSSDQRLSAGVVLYELSSTMTGETTLRATDIA